MQQAKEQPQQPQAPPPTKARENFVSSLQNRTDSDDTIPDESESDSEGPPTPSEPHIKIDEFDWSDLEHRYHVKMDELGRKEQDIYAEFGALCTVGL